MTSSILKHQGVGQKITTGWLNQQGVPETPKTDDIKYEQPLMCDTIMLAVSCFKQTPGL